MNTSQPAGRDFSRFRESGMPAGTSRAIGDRFVYSRDRIARLLVRIGATPNHVTVAGFVVTCGAAVFLLLGARHHAPWESAVPGATRGAWTLWAAAWLFVAGACDMLDGAVARVGGLRTDFGGVLDSVLDRLSEMVLFTAIAIHFAAAGNATYVALSIMALCNGLLISYAKARAEDCVDECGVGFWQRGERSAAMLIAALTAHVPAMLWQQAIFPFFTFLLRVRYARAVIRAQETGGPPPLRIPPRRGVNLLRPWRFPRGTIPYDVAVGFNIALIVVLPWIASMFYGTADPLGDWLSGWVARS